MKLVIKIHPLYTSPEADYKTELHLSDSIQRQLETMAEGSKKRHLQGIVDKVVSRCIHVTWELIDESSNTC